MWPAAETTPALLQDDQITAENRSVIEVVQRDNAGDRQGWTQGTGG